jgi:hypothetical protein
MGERSSADDGTETLVHAAQGAKGHAMKGWMNRVDMEESIGRVSLPGPS